MLKIYIKTSKANLDARKIKFHQKTETVQIMRRILSELFNHDIIAISRKSALSK
jgi:hypothetical protein